MGVAGDGAQAGVLLVLARALDALFNARFDILLYDLTSTYFESDPPFEDKRQLATRREIRRELSAVGPVLDRLSSVGYRLSPRLVAGTLLRARE